MALIYLNDQTKLWELEMCIPQYTGLEFSRENNRIESALPIKNSGTFYTQLVFANTNLTLEVTIHEKATIKESLLGGQSNHEFVENFDHQYRYGIQISIVTAERLALRIPEEYSDLKLDSCSFDTKVQKFRFMSEWMEFPAKDWGIVNLCTFLLVQIPGFSLPEDVVEVSPEKKLAAVS